MRQLFLKNMIFPINGGMRLCGDGISIQNEFILLSYDGEKDSHYL